MATEQTGICKSETNYRTNKAWRLVFLPLAGEESFKLNNDPMVTERGSAHTNRHQSKVSEKVPPLAAA